MKVYELRLGVTLKKDIAVEESLSGIAYFIDSALCKDTEFAKLHSENKYKFYTFNNLYPLATNGYYQKDATYTICIRTVDPELALYFNNHLTKNKTTEMEGRSIDIREVPKKMIQRLHTLSPVVIKDEHGYWRNKLSLGEYEKRLIENLIKKYNQFSGEKIDENFQLYNRLTFKNRGPIACKIKNINLLGDKIELDIETNDVAQELAYFLLGVGIGEMNPRGYGYVNYVWY